jgi:ABC-type branched-subunit amino acid transport system substrate-binding protein
VNVAGRPEHPVPKAPPAMSLPLSPSGAVVQAWARAVEHAGIFATEVVALALHSHQFDAALGRIGFDEKGDVVGYGTYVWHDSEFRLLEEPGLAK